MTKVKKKIGNIPINSIKQDLQQNVTDFISEETAQYPEIGGAFKFIEDPEGRLEVKTDSEDRIISYRKPDGTKVESKIELHEVIYGKEAERQVKDIASSVVEGITAYKGSHLPKYGVVDITTETFYLTADSRYSDSSGIEVRLDSEDTDENAKNKVTIAHYYIKGTDVRLDFYAASKVTRVGDAYYATDSLTATADPATGDTVYEANAESIKVTQVTDRPDVRTWPVDKKTVHYCSVDIDFGHYLSGRFNIGVKFQGSSTLLKRKRNFRFTFYKDGSFAKKDKIKIGEMIRQSGYNLKANWNDKTRIMEIILYRLIVQIWEQRDIYDQYPWNRDNTPYTGATGTIKGFPVRLNIGGSFYGLDIFGLKKDEKNFLLDGPETGIFVSGLGNSNESWIPDATRYWEDEMNDVLSQEDADAINALLAFVNDNSAFTKANASQKMGIISWIDYFICMEVFIMFDSTHRNVILYSGKDKQKFYPFFYDLDFSWSTAYPYNIEFYQYSIDVLGRVLEPWVRIRDLYWDEIVDRYCKLRNTILNVANLRAIYEDVISEIPAEDFINEGRKWGGSYAADAFEGHIDWIGKRLEWLDRNYFKV